MAWLGIILPISTIRIPKSFVTVGHKCVTMGYKCVTCVTPLLEGLLQLDRQEWDKWLKQLSKALPKPHNFWIQLEMLLCSF